MSALTTRVAGAQNAHRQGFWAEIGSGPSAIRINCTGCEDVTRASGTAGYLRLGWALTTKVLVGLETFGFTDDSFGFDTGEGDVLAETAALNVVVLWYPWRSHFFIKSGMGMAEGLFTVTPAEGDSVEAEGLGVGLTFGLGMDVPLSRKFALSLNVSTFFTAIGDIALPDRVVDDVIPTVYFLSFGLVLR